MFRPGQSGFPGVWRQRGEAGAAGLEGRPLPLPLSLAATQRRQPRISPGGFNRRLHNKPEGGPPLGRPGPRSFGQALLVPRLPRPPPPYLLRRRVLPSGPRRSRYYAQKGSISPASAAAAALKKAGGLPGPGLLSRSSPRSPALCLRSNLLFLPPLHHPAITHRRQEEEEDQTAEGRGLARANHSRRGNFQIRNPVLLRLV